MATGFGLFASPFLQAMTSRCIHQCLEGVKKPILVQSGSFLASNAIEQEHYLLGIVMITEHELHLLAVKNTVLYAKDMLMPHADEYQILTPGTKHFTLIPKMKLSQFLICLPGCLLCFT